MTTLASLVYEKREAGYAEAERWAKSFLDECRMPDCPHTAAEHYEARLFLAVKFLKLRDESKASPSDIETLQIIRAELVEYGIGGDEGTLPATPIKDRCIALLDKLLGTVKS